MAAPSFVANDFQARDYNSILRLILDHLSVTAPDWRERHAADLGVTLAELLAYAGDYLSYYQDAVGTEAYLSTARLRTSIRRHARLVDYRVSEGCNARAWIQVRVAGRAVTLPKGTQFVTRIPGAGIRLTTDEINGNAEVFESMSSVTLHPEHTQMAFYSGSFPLLAGATSAALDGHFAHLRKGAVLLVEQTYSHGNPAAGNQRLIYPVRLVLAPKLGKGENDRPITNIQWGSADALPQELAGGDNVIVARGNIVLADHGRSKFEAQLDAVPASGRYKPQFNVNALSFAQPLPNDVECIQSAARQIQQDETDALPQVLLAEFPFPNAPSQTWRPAPDLLSVGRFARNFVLELAGATASIRFGDGRNGRRPQPGAMFTAFYRVGNGPSGNVGPEVICHVVSDSENIVGVTNPLASQGGRASEPIPAARVNAPQAFRSQQRCVTAGDFATRIKEHLIYGARIATAYASRTQTGAQRSVSVYIETAPPWPFDAQFAEALETYLRPYAMLGDQVKALAAKQVAPNIELQIEPNEGAAQAPILSALQKKFSAFFDSANWRMGRPLHPSQIVAAACEVPGVRSARVVKFMAPDAPDPIVQEALASQPHEIITRPAVLTFQFMEAVRA